jgi:hypothetical protein
MSKVGTTEFVRTRRSERNTQTIIDGNAIQIKEGDEIKVNFYRWGDESTSPVSGDIYVNNDLVGWMLIDDLRELLTELFDNAKTFEV